MEIQTTFLGQGKQTPAEIARLLVDFLSGARRSLHIAIYDFRLSPSLTEPLRQVLLERSKAGVEIRLIYDSGQPQEPFPAAGVDPKPPGTSVFVGSLGSAVNSKPITGGDPQFPRLMHHKYIVRDGATPDAVLWTGSCNFTDDSWSLQENNIIRIPSRELCAYFETDFDELWNRGDIATTGAHDSGTVQVGPSRIDVAFAPGEGRSIDHDLAHCISSARRRLRICSMLITSGGILGALSDVLTHGKVRDYAGIFDRTQMAGVFNQWRGTPAEWKIKAFGEVSKGLAGKNSTPYSPNTPHDFMHNKVIVADDIVITGSYNLSHSATENAENVLMIRDPELAQRYCDYVEALVRKYGSPS